MRNLPAGLVLIWLVSLMVDGGNSFHAVLLSAAILVLFGIELLEKVLDSRVAERSREPSSSFADPF